MAMYVSVKLLKLTFETVDKESQQHNTRSFRIMNRSLEREVSTQSGQHDDQY